MCYGCLELAGDLVMTAVAPTHPPLPELWKDYSDWHNEIHGPDHEYQPGHSVQSWGNVEEYLSDRHGLNPHDPNSLDHPMALGMAKLHSLAQARPQVDGFEGRDDYFLNDDELTTGAALGLLRIRKNQLTQKLEPVLPRFGGTYYHRSVNPVGESGQRYPHTYFYQADDPYGVDYETQGYGDHIYQTDIDDSLMEPDPAPRRAPNGAPWFRTSPENVGELTHIHDPTQPFGQPRRKRTSHIHSERIGKVQFPYLRNNGGMRHVPGFDQETEPWGRYMSPDADEHHLPLQQGWERGQVDFDNPLYVPHNYGAWKQELSQAHGGLTGQALSDALLAKGHDGVVTHDKYGIGEIVDIRPKNQRGHRVA